jgi:Flp pilus assembly protein TadB
VSRAGSAPGGVIGWVLQDDGRTARARSLLYPLCATLVVIAVCTVAVALVVLAHTPALTGVVALLCLAGPAGVRTVRARRARRRTTTPATTVTLADPETPRDTTPDAEESA